MSSEIEKSTVYVETTVIGYLSGKLQTCLIFARRQAVSRKWWETAAERFRLFVSPLVKSECGAGGSVPSAERLALIAQLESLAITPSAETLAEELIRRHAIPATELRDSTHISLAAVNGVEYLVSWNFKHIVNPATREKINEVCRSCGFIPPKLCTPEELLEVPYGE